MEVGVFGGGMAEGEHDGRLIAAFDIGSTAAKGTLIERERGIVAERSAGYPTHYGPDGHIEQDPEDWWRAVIDLARGFWHEGWDAGRVEAIALTGQMQDLIPLDKALRPLSPAILYSDARAGPQAERIRATLAARGVATDATRYLDATSPLAKLLWLREYRPESLVRCAHTLFGAKDYVLARLAGVVAGDATTAATTGFYDHREHRWNADWLPPFGLSPAWLPPLPPQTSAAGLIGAEAATLTGFGAGTPVYPGMGDAASATLSAGLIAPGDTYLYLGTTGWAATLRQASGPEPHGIRHLPAALGDLTIAIAPLLNAGSALDWVIALLGLGGTDALSGAPEGYAAFERLLLSTPGRSEGVLFLPYLNGERCPVQDARPQGTFLHLGARSGPGQLGWAVLEGICFALRQVLETLRSAPRSLRILGGMARDASLRQLLADVCVVTVRAPRLPGAAGTLAAAIPVALGQGWFAAPEDAVAGWFPAQGIGEVATEPSLQWVGHYQAEYQRYRRIYPAVAALARE